jgi:DNA-binding transcriptional ArsR family regulator
VPPRAARQTPRTASSKRERGTLKARRRTFARGVGPKGASRRPACYGAPIGALSSTLDDTFFALSDPTRRGILERLGPGPATISELAKPFGLTINGVKKHVGILERADLVVTEKVGRARQCRLGPASMAEATAWMEGHRRVWENRLDRFERYVERTSGGGE